MTNLVPYDKEFAKQQASPLLRKLAEAKARLDEVNEKHEKMESKIEAAFDSLSKRNPEPTLQLQALALSYNEVLAEIQDTHDEITRRTAEETARNLGFDEPEEAARDPEAFMEDADTTGRINEENRQQRRARKKARKQEVVKMFRSLSSLCHPDRTDDKRLHEIFIEAKAVYDSREDNIDTAWHALTYLLNEAHRIIDSSNQLFSHLPNEIAAVERLIEEAAKEMAAKARSEHWRIMSLLQNDMADAADVEYRNVLRNKCSELEIGLQRMRHKLAELKSQLAYLKGERTMQQQNHNAANGRSMFDFGVFYNR